MSYLIIALAAVLAGFIQAVTGFGSPMVMMMVIPYFYDMVTAPALANSISIWLAATLLWKFRNKIEWSSCLYPTGVFLAFNMLAIQMVRKIDLQSLSLAFGVFLVILALYFFLFSQKKPFRANWVTATLCGVVSGLTSGFFGVGGPLMAIYFVSATKSKETYVANIQFLFTLTTAMSMFSRIVNGIYTFDLLPMTAIGVACILFGKYFGLRVLDKLNPGKLQKLVYILVGVSGAVTVVQNIR